jgi:starch synthase (maltosyl-transferring)
MAKINFPRGRERVVIDRILPCVDGGAFPLKRVIGDQIRIEAHLIVEGHERIRAVFRYRKVGEKSWNEMPMHVLGNDEYIIDWQPQEVALWEYDVAAWSDDFENWFDGFGKKAANRDPALNVEVSIGTELAEATLKRSKGDDQKRLQKWVAALRDERRTVEDKTHLMLGGDFARLMRSWPDRQLQSTPSQPFLLLVERPLAAFSTWYEFFPRSFADKAGEHGTFKDAARQLPEVADMGFQVVYLPPIHPIGKVFRKGRNNALQAADDDIGSPWAIGSEEGGHKSLHSQLGDFDDFAVFVNEASRNGLEVAMDIAFQCAPDHPYVKEHPQWFKWRPDGTVQYAENPPKKYQDILPFNFDTEDWQALWLELKSVFNFWIEKGIKIFRVDNPHTKPFPFWRWCIREIKAQHPDVIFLAEAFTRPNRKYWLGKCGFTHGYTYFTWRNTAKEMREYLEELTQSEVKEFFWPNFWPNTPDILHEDLQLGTRATFIGRYVLAATLSSNMGIYGPAYETLDREPFPGKEEYNNNEKYQLKRWDRHCPGSIVEEISRINRIRNSNRCLQRTNNLTFIDTDNEHLLAWIKQDFDRSNQLIIVVNMDWRWSQMGHLDIPLDVLGISPDQSFQVTDLLDPKLPSYTWKGPKNFVKLDPTRLPAHIFQISGF